MSTILQKAVTPKLSTAYLERGLDRVAGFVVPAADAASVTTTAGLFELHGLGFEGTPFSPDEPIDILHVPTSPTDTLVPATGGTDETSRRATGGTFIEHPPFTGTGFTSSGDAVVPLSWLEHTRLGTGARLWRFTPGAEEPELIGTYHGVAFGWQNHLDGDTFHAVPPSKLVGHVVKTDAGTFAADVAIDEDGKPTVVTLVSHREPEGQGFTRTAAGMWARKLPADDVEEIFAFHATATWQGAPVRVVDQGPVPDGDQQVAHITSLLHDARAAERLGMSKLDVGVYEKTVPLSSLEKLTYAQRVPRAWARPGQLEKAQEHAARQQAGAAPGTPPAGTSSGGEPQVQPDTPGGQSDNPMHQHAERLQRVTKGLVDALPKDWKQARVLARMVGKRGELVTVYTGEDDQQRMLKGVSPEVGRALAEIKHASYEQGKGTWMTALITLERSGKLTLNIDRTNEQKWKTPPEPADYAEELRRYPRDEEHIPDWLREKVAAAD